MTFAALRALHAIIGTAIDDIERVYRPDTAAPSPAIPRSPPPVPILKSPPRPARPPRSPHRHTHLPSPPSYSPVKFAIPSSKSQVKQRSRAQTLPSSVNPLAPKHPNKQLGASDVVVEEPQVILDWPDLDQPFAHRRDTTNSPPKSKAEKEEELTTNIDVIKAVNQIVAACAQLSAAVQRPFLTLCDAAMGYHLPSCLRFLEASHTVEILREAGPQGLHVKDISRRISERRSSGHILRLLATHHITREVRPDVFTNNRLSSFIDSGKDVTDLVLGAGSESKYEGTDGIGAFIGLWFVSNSSPYSSSPPPPPVPPKPMHITASHPMHAPFNLAFRTTQPYFEWLERPENGSRLKRFGKAMTGTSGWEVPGAILDSLHWEDLPPCSVVVDVGGGIGSTSMLLANAFKHLRFVVQDRDPVVEMGLAAWKDRCPNLLSSGQAAFQAHDFLTPQPTFPESLDLGSPPAGDDISDSSTSSFAGLVAEKESVADATLRYPAVYLLRVITHDWPDEFVTRILLHLRNAAGPDTKLLIADHLLPLACVDEDDEALKGGADGKREALPGTVRSLAPDGSPLLPNLGKANANAYWMDLTMRVTFNSQERTLRELASLTLTAGWKVEHVSRAEGSLFGHVVAVP
ncbi:hypothetical protein BXZ70DRAFT_865118, partial [Cristinia sonorae]